MGPDNINGKDVDEWEMWPNSPLRMAFEDVDVDMIETLTREGFLTGVSASCPGCFEANWYNSCLFQTLFSPEKMDRVSDEELIRIVRVSNWDHVLETYARSVSGYFDITCKEKLDMSRMNRILRIIYKTIPVVRIKPVTLNGRNDDHIMDMVHNNIVDLDDLLAETINKLLGNFFALDVLPMSVERVKNCMKDMIDFGADTSVSIDLELMSGYVTDLPTKKKKYV